MHIMFSKEPKKQIKTIKKELQTLNLIDRFFYIIYKLNVNFQFHIDLNLLQNKVIDLPYKNELISNNLFETFGENACSEYLLNELQKIFRILKKRFDVGWLEENIDISLLDDYNHLLISRYCYHNWKALIKQEIAIQLAQKRNLESIKSLIISSFEEIVYRTKLDYTWDLYQEGLRSLNSFDLESGPFFSRQTECVYEDVDWITNLSEQDINIQKITLHEKASSKKLINTIDTILKDKKYFNKKYEKSYYFEIEKFINFITQVENRNTDFSLKFITKGKELEFSKIFLYSFSAGFITSNKGQLNKILSDVFNISSRIFENITIKEIENELEKDLGLAFLTNKYLLKPFKDSIK